MAKLVLVVALAVMVWMWWRRSEIRKAIREPARRSSMAEREARALLGLDDDADAAAIRAAHRRLIADAHPDRGGSADRARRLNTARDVLLRRTSD
ncbi:J domain-containing protein [Stakelama saccharophila]|uniref:J domain-containing protein n=1 Tax=Stakelama saccharophila TaxID=3075605 RepID=A0ABZ0BDC4_9SPHN|nr:J domain-containing protein [Stakelama sp. W311]WNO54731.1 J domain-containing protein [Stakelama sp. W311]